MQPTEAELRVPESEAGGADEAASTGPGIAHTPAPETGPSARLFRAPTLPREMHGDGAAKSNTDAGFGEWAGRPGTQRGCNWSARSVDRCEGSERGAVPVSILSVCGVRFRRYERMRGGHCDDSLSNQSMFCSKPAHCKEGSRTSPLRLLQQLALCLVNHIQQRAELAAHITVLHQLRQEQVCSVPTHTHTAVRQ